MGGLKPCSKADYGDVVENGRLCVLLVWQIIARAKG